MTAIVLIRQFQSPKTPEDMHAAAAMGKWCLDLYRVMPRLHFLATDGTRCACIFDAPDAEAVRNVLRSTGFDQPLGLWPATVHPGPGDSAAGDDQAPTAAGSLALVERSFSRPVTFEEVQDLEDRNAACLTLHRVVFVRNYFSTNRQHMICVYQAPDAEAVRRANRQAGLPFERVWSAEAVVPRTA